MSYHNPPTPPRKSATFDDYTLAECFRLHGDPAAAIAEYQRKRWSKISRIVRTARWYGRISHIENSVGRGIRDAVIRRIPPAMNDSALRAMYEVDFA